jgi:lambda family phage portal protein
VLAEDIIHWFEADRPEQLRGAPWLASAMLTVHQIGAYQESAVIAARAGASKMGFYKRTGAGAGNLAALAGEQDEDGDFIDDFTPGHLGVLPDDYDFVGFDPKYPHENYDPFLKTNHRDIATGLGVSYHALTGDLTDVNFSSIRSGTLEEREAWKVRQDGCAAAVLERVYQRWLGAAAFNGRFGQGSQEDVVMRAADHQWQGRRWSWVDPLKDIQATVAAINAGLTSPQRVAAEMGVDVEEVLAQIAAWQAMVAEKRVTFPVVQGGKGKSDAKESDDDKKDQE